VEAFYNKHYIAIDDRGCIQDGFSDAFRQPLPEHICINEQGGYQFRLFPQGEENPYLFTGADRLPMYKYEAGQVVRRTEEEMEADRAAMPQPEAVLSNEERIAELEEALELLLSGVTE